MEQSKTVDVSAGYTAADHVFREKDPYARAKYELTFRWLRPFIQPGKRLFNIGCGSGYFNQLAAKTGLEVTACEPDPDAFALAKQYAPVGCSVYNCGLEDFHELTLERADFIVMHDVLEHIRDDNGAVQRLTELLRPGGLLVLSVPALQSLFGLHDEELGHYRRYTKASLKEVLARKFTIKKLQYFGMLSIPIVLYFSKWLRKPYPISAATSDSLVAKVYTAVCRAETYISEPTGTSVVALLADPRNV